MKTGQPQGWHRAQMMIYMYAVWHDLDLSRGTHLAGEIVYPDKSVKVPPGAVHRGFVNDLGALIRRLASDEPARKVPSTLRNAGSARSAPWNVPSASTTSRFA